jgi:GDP-4-dehydro-6-deoxy-D-mannose reductase
MGKPRVFITGILGFAGSHLAEELLRHGYEVVGNRYQQEPTANIKAVRGQVQLVSLDILNARRCQQIISQVRPDYIFHLAAMASVGKSFSMEQLTFKVNFEGTINMLQAALNYGHLRKLVFVGSADCYGHFRPINKTLTEDQPLNPVSPYSIAKAAAEHASLYYHCQYDLPVVVARAFNHAGPRQAESFVVSAFARQVAMIEASHQKPTMKVGDLSARRDFSDVRDIVRGYRLLAEKGRDGETYQLCSGKALSIKRVLDMLLSITSQRISVRTDPARLRKADIPILRGNNKKAVRSLGFNTGYSLKETLTDTLEYWREKAQGNRRVPAHRRIGP